MLTVGVIVRAHHERWDGGGYPDGLAGDEIPLEARIIACCDSWNAMRTDRAYRSALSKEAARAEMLVNAGHQFDPQLIGPLLRVAEATMSDTALAALPLVASDPGGGQKRPDAHPALPASA